MRGRERERETESVRERVREKCVCVREGGVAYLAVVGLWCIQLLS